jgi:ferritin-like metal-binding protein YciE
MPSPNQRDAKLVQYLTEAFGKEKELETSLQAHIAMTTRAPYKKRLQQHLKETRDHARRVERRVKQLGGDTASLAGRAQEVTKRATALAKGPLHAIRGTGEQEKLLKNAKTEYSEEFEEIATYYAIETLADEVGDRETHKLARSIRKEEERMARFLERLIPQLAKAVAREEIPASERATGRRRRSSSRRASSRRSTSARSSSGRSGGRGKSSSGRRKGSSGGRARARSRSGSR